MPYPYALQPPVDRSSPCHLLLMSTFHQLLRLAIAGNGAYDLMLWFHTYMDRSFAQKFLHTSLPIPKKHGLQSQEIRLLSTMFAALGVIRINAAKYWSQQSSYDLVTLSYTIEAIFFLTEIFIWKSTNIKITGIPMSVCVIMIIVLLSQRSSILRLK